MKTIRFSRHCLENVLIGRIEGTHLVEVALGKTTAASQCKISGEPLEQLLAVVGAGLASLFKLYYGKS